MSFCLFDPEQAIATMPGHIDMKFAMDIRGPRKTILHNFGDLPDLFFKPSFPLFNIP